MERIPFPRSGPEKSTSKLRGRPFQPGVSGNPKGKPPGTRHHATRAALALLEGDLENITRKCVEKATAGEQWAITLILNKLIPNATSLPVAFKLPRMETAADMRVALASILKAVGNGRLTPEEGKTIAEIVNSLGIALTVEDMEAQIEALQAERTSTS